MAKFSLSKSADNVFIIQLSEIQNRIDPLFYNSELNKFISGKYQAIQLYKLVKKFKSGFGAGKQDQGEASDGIIQIRPTNLDEEGFLKFNKNVFLPPNTNADKIGLDDVLFNNTNSQELVGKTAILKENKELFYSNHITKITVDKTKIIPEYLWIILNVYQKNKIFYSICTNWNNQSGVGLELLKSLKIPLPGLNIQANIVETIKKAQIKKQQKEAEAKALLSNIDDYLLKELGIILPQKEESLESRINTNVRLKDLSGSRFDPLLYDKYTIALKEAILYLDNSKFITLPLNKMIIQSFAGDWGTDENEYFDHKEFQKCLVIRATEFDNDYNLKIDNSRVKYRLIRRGKIDKLNICTNDILIEKSGGSPDQPVGRVAIIEKEILDNNVLCFSNFIHKIRVDKTIVNPLYLFCFLKTVHNIKLTEAMQSQTNGIRNLIMSSYFNQNIVLPIKIDGSYDLEKQNEIAEHIQNIRNQAKALQAEAKQILEDAKQEVEQIILG